MPAVDILMPDGTWVRNRDLPQDVANHIGMGADMYDLAGNKLTLIYYNSLSIPNPNNFSPEVWNVVVPGGSGPQSSIPLSDYLATKPNVQDYLTDVGGGTGAGGGSSTTVDVNVDGGGGFYGPDQQGGGVMTAGIGGEYSGLALLGLGALALFALSRKKKP